MALEEYKFDLLLNSPAFVNEVPRGTKQIPIVGKPEPKKVDHYPIDPQGIRVPSLRGVLEFWHRSLLGHLCADPEAIYAQQARIFGSTDGGQGLTLRVAGKPSMLEPGELRFDRDTQALLYLGYGPLQLRKIEAGNSTKSVVTSYNSEHAKDAIPIGQGERPRFSFIARGRKPQLDALRKALILLHLFGGVGSRSRRGWGSVEVCGDLIPLPEEDVVAWIQRTLGEVWRPEQPATKGLPRFSAFSSQTRIYITGIREGDYRVPLLEFYRHFSRVRAYPSSRLARDDHEFEVRDARALQTAPRQAIQDVPRRLAFGMPYKPGHYRMWDIEYRGRLKGGQSSDGEITRRASPLILKVIRLSETRHVGVALFLKSSFFGEAGAEVTAKGAEQTRPFPGYQAISDFFSEGWTKVNLP